MAQGKTEARSGNAGCWSNTKHAALDLGEGDDERRSNWEHLGFLFAPMRAFYVIDSPNNHYRSSRRNSEVKMS
jgi:hypothetical protein